MDLQKVQFPVSAARAKHTTSQCGAQGRSEVRYHRLAIPHSREMGNVTLGIPFPALSSAISSTGLWRLAVESLDKGDNMAMAGRTEITEMSAKH